MATAIQETRLHRLEALGQSIWLDYIDRGLIQGGGLKLIEADGVTGVTSNPSIFEKAISSSSAYDADISRFVSQGTSARDIYETLTVQDIRAAADVLRPVYDRTRGADGFVSLEVSPHLARDTNGTIEEARRLWASLRRPNVMIKIPGTTEGLPAVCQCIGEGINVNVTLLFGLPRYQRVAEVYIEGLDMLAREGKPLGSVASVASFFLSRIDSLADPLLEAVVQRGGPDAAIAQSVIGNVAIASAKAAYQLYRQTFAEDRFTRLAPKGARPQRLLWASTSTKNPAYSDVKYVDALIGPNTVNTVPTETLEAYRDHGSPAATLGAGIDEAQLALTRLGELGIRLSDLTRQLLEEGLAKFVKPYDATLAAIRAKGAL